MAEDHGVVLALQNHRPIIETYRDMLAFIREVDSPGLKACLDPPLMQQHTEDYYRQALTETGDLLVHTHFGGRFERRPDGTAARLAQGLKPPTSDWPTFLRLAREINRYEGHVSYELCSPVLTDHRHEGLEYAMEQAQLACQYMRGVVESL